MLVPTVHLCRRFSSVESKGVSSAYALSVGAHNHMSSLVTIDHRSMEVGYEHEIQESIKELPFASYQAEETN